MQTFHSGKITIFLVISYLVSLKKIFIIGILFWASSVHAQFGDSFPVLRFDQDTVDFGTVREGDSVIYDFNFTNVGTKPLLIKQAYPACGCTYPTYTKGAILPGQRGSIHVVFHSKGFGGQSVVKEVIVINNGPERYARFKAKIIKPSEIPVKVISKQQHIKKKRRQTK
jgi:hypothetical protein